MKYSGTSESLQYILSQVDHQLIISTNSSRDGRFIRYYF